MIAKRQKRLGELLLEAGKISESQLRRALERQQSWGGRLGTNLVMTGAINDDNLLHFLSEQTGIRELNLSAVTIEPNIIAMIPQRVAEQYNLIPVNLDDQGVLTVAFADPTDLNALETAGSLTGKKIDPVITTYSAVLNAIHRYYFGNATAATVKPPEKRTIPKTPSPSAAHAVGKSTAPQKAAEAVDVVQRLNQNSLAERLLGLAHLLVKKGVITEKELADVWPDAKNPG